MLKNEWSGVSSFRIPSIHCLKTKKKKTPRVTQPWERFLGLNWWVAFFPSEGFWCVLFDEYEKKESYNVWHYFRPIFNKAPFRQRGSPKSFAVDDHQKWHKIPSRWLEFPGSWQRQDAFLFLSFLLPASSGCALKAPVSLSPCLQPTALKSKKKAKLLTLWGVMNEMKFLK